MNSWLVFTHSRTSALRSLTWVVGAITNRRLRFAFSSWSAPATDDVAIYLRSVLYRAGMAMRHRSVYTCVSTWTSYAQNRKEGRRRILYVKGALKNRSGRTAMNTWKAWRSSRAEGRRRLVWVAGAIRNRRARIAFSTWAEPVDDEAANYMRSLLHRSAMALRHRSVYMCLNTWMTWAHTRLRALWGIGALKNRRARVAMSTWIAWQQSRLQGRGRIFYVAGALMNLRIRMAMNSWLVFTQSRTSALHSLWWVVGAITNRRLRVAFSTWAEPSMDDVAVYLRSLGQRAALALRHRSVYMCLNTWISWAYTRREPLRRAKRAMLALLNRRVHFALNSWLEFADSRVGARRSLLWVVSAISNRRLRVAFSTWAEPTFDDVAIYLRSLAYRAGMAMRHRSAYMCLNTWMTWVHDRLKAQRRALSVLQEMSGRGVRRGWFKWTEVLMAKRKVKFYVNAIRLRQERGALRSWTTWLKDIEYIKHILNCLRPAGQKLRRALNTWCMVWRGSLTLKRVASTFVRQAERLAFNSWLAHASCKAMELARLGLRLSVSHLSNRQLSRAWNHWLNHFEWPAVALKLHLLFDSCKLKDSFNFWRIDSRQGRNKRMLRKLDVQTRAAATQKDVLAGELLTLEKAASKLDAERQTAAEQQQHAKAELEQERQRAAEELKTEKLKAAAEFEKQQRKAADEFDVEMKRAASELEKTVAQQGRLSDASMAVKSEKEALSLQLDELRETTSSELARLGREAALSNGLKEEVALLRADLMSTDAAGSESGIKLAASEREVARLTMQLEAVPPPAAPPPPKRTMATSPPPQTPTRTMSTSPPPPPPQLTPSPALLPTPVETVRTQSTEASPSPRRPVVQMHAVGTSPPPFRLRAPPPIKPPIKPPAIASPDELSPVPGGSRTVATSTLLPAPPPSESLLRHTVASRGWDNHRRRVAAAWRSSSPRAWTPGAAHLDMFGGQRFLQEVEKDAENFGSRIRQRHGSPLGPTERRRPLSSGGRRLQLTMKPDEQQRPSTT